MVIGSKLPPQKVPRTYFSSGRAAFAYLVQEVVRPQKVYLPAFTCWSLVAAMTQRFPHIPLEFYPVARDLTCIYPRVLAHGEALVFMHFFGHENRSALPTGEGTLIEDFSHSYLSRIKPTGHYSFGSYRKISKVADGGFVDGFFNPVYEPGRKLDSWLRLEAGDWRDMREAENMLDREWQIADISSQSLAILLSADPALIRAKRQTHERFLAQNLKAGEPHVAFREHECPLIHSRLFSSTEERDSLRNFLAANCIYTSIHWPTHEKVLQQGAISSDPTWLEKHVISFPVSHDLALSAMEEICRNVELWKRGGA